ncbi:MAG TPA: transposase [Actinoallomurus sp.]|jgi:transposase|nr:transposase [Actinoallomurus sp.]
MARRGRGEGFRIVAVKLGDVRRLSRHVGEVKVPKVGWVRFRWSRAASGWGQLVARLEHKAPERVIKVNPRYTSQTCNTCNHTARESRESQALFRCGACGHQDNADVNAARNIADTAAGRAVAARGGSGLPRPTNREPQLLLLSG